VNPLQAVIVAGVALSLSLTAPVSPSSPRPPAPQAGVVSPHTLDRPEPPVPAAAAPKPEASREPAGPERPVVELSVAVGLAPEAVGSPVEKSLLERLAGTVASSADPRVQLRHLRPGAGDGQFVCLEHRDDLVILVGYVPDQSPAVLLAYDCRLDTPLGIRGAEAAGEVGLVRALWAERTDLIERGMRERGQRMGKKARAWVIGGVALAAVGVAIGFLIAGALRTDTVVLKVGP